jgi:hypothetical protein
LTVFIPLQVARAQTILGKLSTSPVTNKLTPKMLMDYLDYAFSKHGIFLYLDKILIQLFTK